MNIHTYIYIYIIFLYMIIHNILALLFNAWALLVGRRLLLRTPAGHQTPSLGIQGAKQPFPAHSAGPKRRPGSWSGHGVVMEIHRMPMNAPCTLSSSRI